MSEFISIATSFPTLLFTIPLGLILLYWLLVLVGGLDLGLFDSFAGLEGAEGTVDGALDGIDSAAEGAAEGLDSVEATDHAGALSSLLTLLGIAGVPLTIPVSFLVLFGWALSYMGTLLVGGTVSDGGGLAILMGSGVAIVAFGVSLLGTAVAVRPLRPLFRTHLAPTRRAFVGKVGEVRTQRVDRDFGQAEIADGGAGLVVEVRCLEVNALTRGSRALVYDYDASDEVYLVVPADEA